MSENLTGFLRDNVHLLAKKSLAGNPNIILIFGATRSGKSTLSFKIAKEISEITGVAFHEDNISFDANELVELANMGTHHAVYVLDEGAFQAKGEDWQNSANKTLRKFFNTAAMFAQTFIINIPFLGSLHKDFVKDEHTVGIRTRTYFNKNASDPKEMYKKGFCKLYKKHLIYQWRGERDNLDAETLWKYKADAPACTFTADISFIDFEKYQKKKTEAIAELSDFDTKNKRDQWLFNVIVYLHKRCDIPQTEIAKIAGCSHITINNIVRKKTHRT